MAEDTPMRFLRARRATFVVVAALSLVTMVPATGGATVSTGEETYPEGFEQQEEVLYPLTFPVVAPTYYSDTFGACRGIDCSRTHEGIDIMGWDWKGLPVVAAHDGTITITTESAGRDCCAIWGLEADDGWKTVYIHLNNDTPGTDDGNGWGIAPGMTVGTRVTAGQLIGWVGDSGTAEATAAHLHFELRKPDGTAVNPYPSLRAASHMLFPRLQGQSRFDTAVAISQDAFPSGADTVLVATGYNYPDALAAGPAAAKDGAPVLLTNASAVPQATLEEIDRLSPSTIYVMGGEMVVEESVIDALASHADEVVRLWGRNRYGTAAAVSGQFFDESTDVVYIANGGWFPGAVAGAPAAAANGAPLLLTLSNRLVDETIVELQRLQPSTIVIIGGTGIVSGLVEVHLRPYADTVVRIPGESLYDGAGMAAEIAEHTYPGGASRVYLARGDEYPDALAGFAVAHRDSAPILFVDDTLPAETAAAITSLGATEVVIFGGTAAVPTTVDTELWTLLTDNDMPVWQ